MRDRRDTLPGVAPGTAASSPPVFIERDVAADKVVPGKALMLDRRQDPGRFKMTFAPNDESGSGEFHLTVTGVGGRCESALPPVS